MRGEASGVRHEKKAGLEKGSSCLMPSPSPPLLSRRTFLSGAALGTLCACSQGLSSVAPEVMSPADEIKLGRAAWQDLLKKEPRSDNTDAMNAIEKIGRQCAVAARMNPAGWQFALFKGKEINAFALPGGHVGVYEGILPVMQDANGMATVLGHEISHVALRHAAKRASTQVATNVLLQVTQFGLALGGVQGGDAIAGALGTGASLGILLPFSRNHEYEADALGLRVMAAAGYDPRAAVPFWQRMQAANKGKTQPEYFSTHPGGGNRIAALEALMPEAVAIYERRRGKA